MSIPELICIPEWQKIDFIYHDTAHIIVINFNDSILSKIIKIIKKW